MIHFTTFILEPGFCTGFEAFTSMTIFRSRQKSRIGKSAGAGNKEAMSTPGCSRFSGRIYHLPCLQVLFPLYLQTSSMLLAAGSCGGCHGNLMIVNIWSCAHYVVTDGVDVLDGLHSYIRICFHRTFNRSSSVHFIHFGVLHPYAPQQTTQRKGTDCYKTAKT